MTHIGLKILKNEFSAHFAFLDMKNSKTASCKKSRLINYSKRCVKWQLEFIFCHRNFSCKHHWFLVNSWLSEDQRNTITHFVQMQSFDQLCHSAGCVWQTRQSIGTENHHLDWMWNFIFGFIPNPADVLNVQVTKFVFLTLLQI